MSDPTSATPTPDEQPVTHRGPGRVLIPVYAVFAVAATGRATYQLITKYSDAPLAYLLSAFAAVLYIVITIALVRGTRTARRIATVGIIIELVGVLVVGTLSFVDSQLFPRATVWSHFGEGYLFVPVVLPILGLLFLRKQRLAEAGVEAQ
jgi:hypothetical protein